MKKISLVAIAFIVVLLMMTGCASTSRWVKDVSSEYSGGLNRTVTVYDMQGEPIREYTGKIDVEANEGKVLFDLNGKRTIIYNATVIVQEN